MDPKLWDPSDKDPNIGAPHLWKLPFAYLERVILAGPRLGGSQRVPPELLLRRTGNPKGIL